LRDIDGIRGMINFYTNNFGWFSQVSYLPLGVKATPLNIPKWVSCRLYKKFRVR